MLPRLGINLRHVHQPREQILFTDWKLGTSVNEVSQSQAASFWGFLSEVLAKDDTPAVLVTDSSNNMQTNQIVAHEFQFNVPPGATILGVFVRTRAFADDSLRALQIQLGDAFSAATSLSLQRTVSDGGYDDVVSHNAMFPLWNLALTPADVNDPDFGVHVYSFDFETLSGTQFYLDSIEARIRYSL